MSDEIAIGLTQTGVKIREARHERGMTQRQLADACDMLQTEVSNIERGSDRIGIKKYKRLCAFLKVHAHEVLWAPESDKAVKNGDKSH